MDKDVFKLDPNHKYKIKCLEIRSALNNKGIKILAEAIGKCKRFLDGFEKVVVHYKYAEVSKAQFGKYGIEVIVDSYNL